MAKPLQEYARKRNFDASPEPAGNRRTGKKAAHALQYCIQKHDASHLHYDFRLELDGTLKSWAIPKGPSLDPKVRRLAVHVEDHPLDYADFEGHIPEGHYGAGDVIVWDRGVWIPEEDPHKAYAQGKLRFRLQGEKLSGIWNLFRTHLAGKKEQWLLIKSDDAQARPQGDYDILQAEPDSVLSERTLIARKPKAAASKTTSKTTLSGARKAALPDSLKPELATLVETPPEGDWRYEVKFDGYRILARIDGDDVRLFTRNGHDWTAKLPRQAKALGKLGVQAAWLDGEMVVANEHGVADFQALQNAFDQARDEQIIYYLFDLPYLNGMDLRTCPLEQRRAGLEKVLEKADDKRLRFSADFAQSVESLLDSACKMQMEGLIGKRLGSSYLNRRSSDWIKLKCKQRQEFVIVGYTDPKGSREAFGALLLALHDDSGALRYAGKVGSGFNSTTLAHLHQRLTPLEVAKPQFGKPPTGAEAKGVHWLKPRLLAEVAYAQMTRDGVVRHSVFHGLRDDKPAKAIGLEQPVKTPARKTSDLHLTHPERIIDASTGTTKRQVAEYYALVAEWILPHLKRRPVALVRAPDGLAGELFFQKNAAQLNIPGLESHDKAEAGQALMIIDQAQTLLGAVQMNTLELHTWNATAKDFDKPDRLILDLDPDPALPWKAMLEATQLTLALLDELGLQSFLKTSGGKGMHIVVPLTRRASWDEVKGFSQAMVQHLAGLFPERLSAVSGPKNRVGRIFIDYLRNGKGATTVCAYSIRARDGLPVSVPIRRQELTELKGANQWNLLNLGERLAEGDDPWADYGQVRQSISKDLRRRMGVES
ncbi:MULTISPECIES: DNA ligase D [Pseudomonas]|uniref:DNA ligase (ATP) n=1 Tax=Pseudomonas fluorescens TaxID=294 RepID=A0A5E6STK9_PSEFL|nr:MULTISPECIES: DNA ligase D [Pseudomonas]VVM80715.1 Multifunctional non-homologous end joining protein LigD [Pseudomonas fluorescens]